jgi:hypothetical protein
VEVTGDFEGEGDSAWMRIVGRQGDEAFDETVPNFSCPLEKFRSLLRNEGFSQVSFSDLEDLGEPVSDPETLDRVMVIACL